MKELKHAKDTNSYMQLCLQIEGGNRIYLMIPTYWDSTENQWIGAIFTPETKKMIRASGKNSFELQNNFNISLKKIMEEIPQEVFSMFKPLEYWEARLG